MSNLYTLFKKFQAAVDLHYFNTCTLLLEVNAVAPLACSRSLSRIRSSALDFLQTLKSALEACMSVRQILHKPDPFDTTLLESFQSTISATISAAQLTTQVLHELESVLIAEIRSESVLLSYVQSFFTKSTHRTRVAEDVPLVIERLVEQVSKAEGCVDTFGQHLIAFHRDKQAFGWDPGDPAKWASPRDEWELGMSMFAYERTVDLYVDVLRVVSEEDFFPCIERMRNEHCTSLLPSRFGSLLMFVTVMHSVERDIEARRLAGWTV